MRIVMVEDSEAIRRLLRLILTERSHQVVGEADNGAEAPAVVALTQPDGVILDDMMPVMDGLAALPLIRRACPSATVVMFCTLVSDDLAVRAARAGAVAVVEKSAGVDAMLAALERNTVRAGG